MDKPPFCLNAHVSLACEMQQMRLKLNQPNYDLLKELCYEEWEKCKTKVVDLTGNSTFNVGSPKQVQSFFYRELKLKPKTKRGTGKETSDEDALRELRVQYPQHKEVLNAIIEERHIKKRIESYIEFRLDDDGYIPYSANPAGTETNRWSFSKSPRNRGFNAQTPPKTMRIMCDAPPGHIFICPDLPQADARVVAWDAQCLRQIELFNDPTRQFHLENSIGIKGLTKEQVYEPSFKETELYTVGKRRGHAANYRQQAQRLAMDLGCEKKYAQWLLDDYFCKAPEILRWHDIIKERIRKYGGLRTPEPFNRFRTFYTAWAELLLRGKISNSSWNEACAHIPQSVVADIINVGTEKLWKEKGYVRFHLHHHDSYLASVPYTNLGEACMAALEALKVTLMIHNRPLTMVPDMQVGYNYGLMVPWNGESILTYDDWYAKIEKKLDREKLRKGLYGYY